MHPLAARERPAYNSGESLYGEFRKRGIDAMTAIIRPLLHFVLLFLWLLAVCVCLITADAHRRDEAEP